MRATTNQFKSHDRIALGLMLACAAGFFAGCLVLIWS